MCLQIKTRVIKQRLSGTPSDGLCHIVEIPAELPASLGLRIMLRVKGQAWSRRLVPNPGALTSNKPR